MDIEGNPGREPDSGSSQSSASEEDPSASSDDSSRDASGVAVTPELRVLVAFGMAAATAGLVAVVWLTFGLDDLAPALVGCIAGMLILVGFTSVGREMCEDVLSWRELVWKHDRAQRREISRAVRQGRAVREQRIARDAIRMADQIVQRFDRSLLRPSLLIVFLFFVLALIGQRWIAVLISAVFLALIVSLEPLRRRNVRNARRSKAANQELLDSASS